MPSTPRSPKPPGPYSLEELADDAAEALEGRRAHVAGFSMGGYLAQLLALRHPQLVERLGHPAEGIGNGALGDRHPEQLGQKPAQPREADMVAVVQVEQKAHGCSGRTASLSACHRAALP